MKLFWLEINYLLTTLHPQWNIRLRLALSIAFGP